MEFIRTSRTYESKKLALRFLVLTAARTSEVLGLRRGEIDLKTDTWTIPADRTKSGREHRVPLTVEAVSQLKKAGIRDGDDPDELLFTDPNGKPLNPDALRVLLKRRYPDATPHGFRSSFRDWVAAQTDYPAEHAEHALAHLESSQTIRAYLRTDMFDKRRDLMWDWSNYIEWGMLPARR